MIDLKLSLPSPSLLRASWRFAFRSPGQLALALAGIALGVAVIIAIELTIDSAKRSFEVARDAVSGASTHRIVAGPEGVDERIFAVMYARLPHVPAAVIVQGTALIEEADGVGSEKRVQVLGLDPLASPLFRTNPGWQGLFTDADAGAGVLSAGGLLRSGTAVLPASLAWSLSVERNDFLRVQTSAQAQLGLEPARLQVIAVFGGSSGADEADADQDGLGNLLVVDVATAQELLDMTGRVSAIDLILTRPEDVEVLRQALPGNVELETAASRTRAMVEMTRAFELNLRMLALLALVIGAFLIYNTMSFSVARRRFQFGVLRALGLQRRELVALVLLEAGQIGLAGAIAGLALGYVLADGLLSLVTQTINDFYFLVEVRTLHLSAGTVALAFACGLLAALAAAVMPALRIAHINPAGVLVRSAFDAASVSTWSLRAKVGAGLLMLAMTLLYGPGGQGTDAHGLVLGFTGLFVLVAGAALLTAPLIEVVLKAMGSLTTGRRAMLIRLAVAGARSNLPRTSVAAAALMVALAATVGVGVMVDSFRDSVQVWLERTLQADIYVGGPGTAENRRVAPGLVQQVEALPQVNEVSLGRRVKLRAGLDEQSRHAPAGKPVGYRSVSTLVLRMATKSYASLDVLAPAREQARAAMWQAFETEDAVLVTEPYANRRGVGVGGQVVLLTPYGHKAFNVVGVYRDYASEQGSLLMSRRIFMQHWRDPVVTGMGVYLKPGADAQAALRAVDTLLVQSEASTELVATSNRAIKVRSMAIFDRTFTVTHALRLVALLVAVCGVFSALLAVQLERSRHFARLRAQGLTRQQLFTLVELETCLIGLLAGIASIPLGIALAHALVNVINLRAFGWSMGFSVEPTKLILAVALAVVAAAAAGLWPAWRIASAEPAAALRGE